MTETPTGARTFTAADDLIADLLGKAFVTETLVGDDRMAPSEYPKLVVLLRKAADALTAAAEREAAKDREIERLTAVDSCYWCVRLKPYLKENETPEQCIERNRKDIDATLTLLAESRAAVARLKAERDKDTETIIAQRGVNQMLVAEANEERQKVQALRERWIKRKATLCERLAALPEHSPYIQGLSEAHQDVLNDLDDALGLLPAAPVGETDQEISVEIRCENCDQPIPDEGDRRVTDDDVTLCVDCWEGIDWKADAPQPAESK